MRKPTILIPGVINLWLETVPAMKLIGVKHLDFLIGLITMFQVCEGIRVLSTIILWF